MTKSEPDSNIALPEFADNKTGKPIEIYSEEFSKKDPAVLSARCGLPYEEASRHFTLKVINRPVEVSWPEMIATYSDTNERTPDSLRILLGRLLMEGKLVPSTGEFINYAKVPWGEAYLKAFDGRCIKRLSYMFKSAEAFSRAAERIGAIPSPINGRAAGDASYDLEFVDNIWVRLTIWEADEDFPPSAQILFSDNITFAFTAEDIACLSDIFLSELKKNRE